MLTPILSSRLFTQLDRRVVFSIVLAWLAALFLFELLSVINDSGTRVQFASGPAFRDFPLYASFEFEKFAALWRPFEFTRITWTSGVAAGVDWLKLQVITPGPIYSALIHLFRFQESPALLSGIYLLLGALLGLAWASWAKKQGLPWAAQIVLGAFPFLVYYSVLVSTDLLFAVWACILFCVLYWTNSTRRIPFFLLASIIFLAVLTRPTGLTFVGIAGLFLVFRTPEAVFKTTPGLLFLFFLCFVAAWGLLYYAPYYLMHDANGDKTHYFGLLPYVYKAGLFPDLPDSLSKLFSYALFAGAKILHAVGFRPSYASIDPVLTLLRALPGLIFLPGLVLVFFRGSFLERLFVGVFMLPVFVAASQERYILAIMPILFCWGWVFWASVFKSFGSLAHRLIVR